MCSDLRSIAANCKGRSVLTRNSDQGRPIRGESYVPVHVFLANMGIPRAKLSFGLSLALFEYHGTLKYHVAGVCEINTFGHRSKLN